MSLYENLEANPFLRDGSPVKPYYIDGHSLLFYVEGDQLARLEVGRLGRINLIAICGGEDWLKEQFPRWSPPTRWPFKRPPEIIGFDQSQAAAALIEACCQGPHE